MITRELLKTLLADYVQTDWGNQLASILDGPACEVSGDISELNVLYILGTTEIQMNTTRKANKKTFGFDELIKSLRSLEPKERLTWITVKSTDWIGRCIVNHDKTKLIGCAFVESPKRPVLKTPPNWDGTQEMLDEYNKNRKD